MNRNTNMHFSNTPSIKVKRSKFDESHSIKTTFNAGDVIPIYVDADILPGDTVSMDMAEIIRMATPIYPIMDNLYTDIYWFFVPSRLLWEHWVNFWGENDSPWTQSTQYEIPQIEAPTGGWTEGTIADYMGVPTKVDGISINSLPFRAYAKIWNDWFRDENLKSCCHMYEDETTRTGQTGAEVGYDYVTGTELGGTPCKAAKFHDYFTSCLPSPQKGTAVGLPLTGSLDVYAGEPRTLTGEQYPASFKYLNITTANAKTGTVEAGKQGVINSAINQASQTSTTTYPNSSVLGTGNLTPNNLYADMTTATAITVNELRKCFALQKYFENAGLHGTRYIEYLKGVFGVTSSDARLQRAEYLGGQRVPLNIDQIIQTSSTFYDRSCKQFNIYDQFYINFVMCMIKSDEDG